VIPGLAAAALMAFAVQERGRRGRCPGAVQGQRARAGRRASGSCWSPWACSDWATSPHTLLILLAVQQLTPMYGATVAVTAATGLYILHNALYAAFSMSQAQWPTA